MPTWSAPSKVSSLVGPAASPGLSLLSLSPRVTVGPEHFKMPPKVRISQQEPPVKMRASCRHYQPDSIGLLVIPYSIISYKIYNDLIYISSISTSFHLKISN